MLKNAANFDLRTPDSGACRFEFLKTLVYLVDELRQPRGGDPRFLPGFLQFLSLILTFDVLLFSHHLKEKKRMKNVVMTFIYINILAFII